MDYWLNIAMIETPSGSGAPSLALGQHAARCCFMRSFLVTSASPQKSSRYGISRLGHIQSAVAEHFGVDVQAMLGRAHRLARPRHVAMFLAHQLTNLSYSELGRAFHRHHSVIFYAIRKVAGQMGDPEFAAMLAEVEEAVLQAAVRPQFLVPAGRTEG